MHGSFSRTDFKQTQQKETVSIAEMSLQEKNEKNLNLFSKILYREVKDSFSKLFNVSPVLAMVLKSTEVQSNSLLNILI